MPRATRYLENGYLYHLTHRCADGEFFLRFAKERDTYREWLRIGSRRYQVPVLGYAITSNHAHVVVDVHDRLAVANMMKLASQSVAQTRNRRKGHEGSVWEHPYQCTRIQSGSHLLNCLHYVDLNMVRTGVIDHPGQWRWCGFDELTGKRKRYRIVNQARLLSLMEFSCLEEFATFYADRMRERLAGDGLRREPYWTEAIAVGSEDFVENAEKTVQYRQHMNRYEVETSDGEIVWAVRENVDSYRTDSDKKSGFEFYDGLTAIVK